MDAGRKGGGWHKSFEVSLIAFEEVFWVMF